MVFANIAPVHNLILARVILRSRYQGRHATLLEERCVTTLITAAKETRVMPERFLYLMEVLTSLYES